MATKTQLIGGAFQDSRGNLLANGYLTFKLSQDSSVPAVGNIASGVEIKIQLDSAANVASSTSTPVAANQYLWSNSVLLPVNSYYRVTGYTATGQVAWGPNNQQITSGGSGGGTFDLGTWIPNSVVSWTPPIQPLTLETNGVENGDQTLLNLVAGTNVTLTDNGTGSVSVGVSGITGITLETNGTPNGSQTILNLKRGAGTAITDDGVGGVTVATNLAAGQNISITGSNPQTISAAITPTSGQPLFPQPTGSPGWSPIAAAFIGSDITLVQGFTGSALIFPGVSAWKFTLTNQSSTFTVDSVNVAKCTPGTGAVISSTPVSFGGVFTNISILGGANTCDTITLPLDSAFDYYIRVRISGSGGNVNFYQLTSGVGNQFPGGFKNLSGSHETDNPVVISGAFTNTGASLLKIFAA